MRQLTPFSGSLSPLGMARAGMAGPTVLFYDTFTDANGTLLTAHTPDVDVVGGGWVLDAGTITIQSNRAQATAALARYFVNAGHADTTVSMDIISDAGGAGGFIVRWQNSLNHWICRLLASTGRIQIFDVNAGTLTLRAETAVVVAYPATLTVVMSGTTITLTYNSLSASYSSSFLQTQTRHGLRLNNTIVDNFQMTAP
jgi:hypothetical protein